MITLPRKPDYTLLKSFWIVFCVLACALLAVLLAAGDPGAYAGFALLALFLIAAGLRRPEVAARPYRYCNGVLKRISRGLRGLMLIVMDKAVLPLLRQHGGAVISRERQPQSLWRAKDVVDINGLAAPAAVSIEDSGHRPPMMALARWMLRTGRWRLLPVVPWLAMLSLLSEAEARNDNPAHTYTLY